MVQLIIHGGAGRIRDSELYRRGIRQALSRGNEVLRSHGALEAVLAAVCSMEDDPIFNCGTGSALNLEGEVEMDASLMTSDGCFGAVGGLMRVQNPILVARKVMEETDHLLIVGDGAEILAQKWGFPVYDPRTEAEKQALEELKRAKESVYLPRLAQFLENSSGGTVGAVARDEEGHIAVATSTGGILGKLKGRVGDSAVLGAGTYASPWGGISATGHGEAIMKFLLAFNGVEDMKEEGAPRAIEKWVKFALDRGCRCGLIGVDWRGNLGFAFNTQSMAFGYVERDDFFIF